MKPKLRFKEFNGDWEEKRLGDIVTFLDGKRKPLEKRERISGKYPYYGASGIIDYVKDYIFDEELILLSEDGANIIDRNYRVCFLARGKYWVNNHAHVLKAKENNYNAFVCEALERLNYQKYNTGTAQPKLNQDVCKKIILNTPSLPEQTKIADFLSTVDEKIQNQQDKITHLENIKKGFMQKIFSRKIRFKDANGNEFPEWEEKKIKDILREVVEKTTVLNQYEVLSSTSNGIFTQKEYFNRDIASKDNIGYKVLRINQIVLSPQNLWMGNINLNKFFKIGMVSPSYKIFNIVKGNDVNFMGYFLRTPKAFYEYTISSEQGASIVRRNLNMDLFNNIKFKLPCLEEQQKIADFLSSFDDKIDAEKETLEHLKELKKGLLQQMFV